MNVVRYADRPDLREIRFETLSRPTFPEYMAMAIDLKLLVR